MSTLQRERAAAEQPAPQGLSPSRRFFAKNPVFFILPAIILLLAFAVYPLIVLIRMALSDVGPSNIIGVWHFVGLDNFRSVLGSAEIWHSILRTLVVSLVLLASNLIIGFLAASILSIRGGITNVVLAIMVFVWALPPLVSGSVWKFLLDDSGAINKLLGIIGAGPVSWLSSPSLAIWTVAGVIAWASLPFSALILRGGLLAVPREVVEASIPADVDRAAVARAGASDIDSLLKAADRNDAMVSMARGAAAVIRGLYDQERVAAVIVLGGSNAGFVMSQIAAALPIGCPKILVSTIVAGDTRPYVGTSDLTMMYPVVDIAGLNSISMQVLARAADACAGMVTGPPVPPSRPGARSIACSMFGVTTTCVTAVHDALVSAGDEVRVFHANGTGGRTLEAMIDSGFFAAVADITTTELADELLGGVCSAGPGRLEAPARQGIPQVVSVGALDMVNFGAPDTVPDRFAGRLFHAHNPAVTLMRTNAAECAELGAVMATKLNASTGHVEVLVPARGFSQISVEGAPFFDPGADAALIEALQRTLHSGIPLHIVDAAINDALFADEIPQR